MTGQTNERPRKGQLPLPKGSRLTSAHDSGYEQARDGDIAGGLLIAAEREREQVAGDLHVRLVSLSHDYDYAAKRLEAGEREHILSHSSYEQDLPRLNAKLAGLNHQIRTASNLAEYGKQPSVEAKARSLEIAAAVLDSEVEAAGLNGSHPDGDKLRGAAALMRLAEDDRVQAERAEREREAAKKLAALKRKPLGVAEKAMLDQIGQYEKGYLIGRYMGDRERKAVSSLTRRGLVGQERRRVEDRMEQYATLTDEGKAALAKEALA